MLNYLENLRNRPEAERKKAVLKISLSVTLVIAIIWGITLYIRISSTDFTNKKEGSVPTLKETFSNIGDKFKSIFGE